MHCFFWVQVSNCNLLIVLCITAMCKGAKSYKQNSDQFFCVLDTLYYTITLQYSFAYLEPL